MSNHHETVFDEALLSGYVDGELTQADRQRVRLRLEEDPEARQQVDEMREIREAARSVGWMSPSDEEWNEAPRSAPSRVFRGAGWLIVCGWLVTVAFLVLKGFVLGPETLGEKLLALAVVGGPLALFLSVLIDRIKVLPNDRYTGVKK